MQKLDSQQLRLTAVIRKSAEVIGLWLPIWICKCELDKLELIPLKYDFSLDGFLLLLWEFTGKRYHALTHSPNIQIWQIQLYFFPLI